MTARLAALSVLLLAAPALGEIIHLKNGITLEVDSCKDRGNVFRVHSWQGTYNIDKRRIESIEPSRKPLKSMTADERKALKQAKKDETEVRRRVSEWAVKIKSIERGRLSVKETDARRPLFNDGRNQILAIRDPLAIPALAQVLSHGNLQTRLLLVEALSKFEEDEATMNLLVMSLADSSADVRDAAAQAMIPRCDDRVAGALCHALDSEKESTIRAAAAALGKLKVKGAIPLLIDALSTEIIAPIRLTDPLFLDYVMYLYGRPVGYGIGAARVSYQPANIGVYGSSTLMGSIDHYELAVVSVYRTQVQEALIAITGQNFGFDRDAWFNWWQRQK
ncbi:MAG TPA: HEAT repeat domain-containing protein [Phycisphaerae bacterium]|nr:HEAT repeat domain-containing protein [Phycisphaerae bacterium]